MAISNGAQMLHSQTIRSTTISGQFPISMLYSREKSTGKSVCAKNVLKIYSHPATHKIDPNLHYNRVKIIGDQTQFPMLLEDVQKTSIIKNLAVARYDPGLAYHNMQGLESLCIVV